MSLSSNDLSALPNGIAAYDDGLAVASLHSSSTFPQQFLQRSEPHFSIDSTSFDDYSFAPPILRTTSFECDDDETEVFYTPVTQVDTDICLAKWESKSLPVTSESKKLDFQVSKPASRSMQSSPSSSLASTWESRSKMRLNLPFKLKGFRNIKNGKGHSLFRRNSKKSPRLGTSEFAIDSVRIESPLSVFTYESQQVCSSSCNSIAETEVFSNLTSRSLQEGDANDSVDDIQLNPISYSTKYDQQKPGNCLREIAFEEVEVVYNDNIKGVVDINEDCDLYFSGGSLHTIHGAFVELSVLAKAASAYSGTDDATDKSCFNVAPPTNTSTASVSSASASTCSMSTSSQSSTSSSGILKPPKRAVTGYDPFGVHTDFTTGIPKRHVHFENIDDIETAYARDSLLLSQTSDSSDDSTLSLEYAFRYLGCASTFSGASSGDCDEDV